MRGQWLRLEVRKLAPLSLLTLVLLLPVLPYSVHAAQATVGANVPIVGEVSPDRQQVETTIAVDPRNPSIIVAGAQDYRLRAGGEHRWHGYYRSTDGGATWSQSLLPGFPGDNSAHGLASPLHRSNATSDPVLAFDRQGNVYYTGLVFNITGPDSNSTIRGNTAFVAKYTNDGANYTSVTMIRGVTDADKPWIAVDTSGGPNDGSVYVAFDATIGLDFATVFTRSTDGGKTFSTPFFAPSDKTGELPGMAVDTAGNVYVSTVAFDSVTGAPLNYIQVTRITNGGTVIAANVKAVNPANSLPSTLPGGRFRTFTIPQITADSQGVYLVFDDYRTGDANVFLTKSTDGGMTWSSPNMVNDVATGEQFFPTITSSAGTLSVAWYDSRFNAGPTLTTLDLFYSESTDAGVSFAPSVRVTSVSFNPELVNRTDAPNYSQVFMGDYIGIAASPTMVHPVWADNRFACDTVDPRYGCVDQDAFTAAITVTPPQPVHDVAVYGFAASRNFAYSGVPANPVNLSVTAVNLGSVSESFAVAFKAGTTTLATQNVMLVAGGSASLRLAWNTQPLARGNYTLSAQASTVPFETNTANNIAAGPVFDVKFQGDVVPDCTVNILDIATIAFAYGSTPSSLLWNPYADLDNNGVVNIIDVATAAINYGKSC